MYGNLNAILLKEMPAVMTPTLNAVHEGGHNSADNHLHGMNYEYDQAGLQSNTSPYPSKSNAINIIQDANNRRTLAE